MLYHLSQIFGLCKHNEFLHFILLQVVIQLSFVATNCFKTKIVFMEAQTLPADQLSIDVHMQSFKVFLMLPEQ